VDIVPHGVAPQPAPGHDRDGLRLCGRGLRRDTDRGGGGSSPGKLQEATATHQASPRWWRSVTDSAIRETASATRSVARPPHPNPLPGGERGFHATTKPLA